MNWINRELYPFESRYVEIDGHRMHYVDEGKGPVILFSHGTPEWSFGWRDLIKPLRAHYRCIAPDLLGMGLSDKPVDADYRCAAHAARLEMFIKKLGLTNPNIVANDFGLSIALSYAIRHPENVGKISIFNGWMWPMATDPHYARPVGLMQGWLGRLLYLRFNFPVTVIMPMAFGNRKKYLPKEVHRHYKMALPDPASRVAAYTFAKEVLNASPWWDNLWQQRNTLKNKPMLIFWGMKDSFVPPYELEKWKKAFPEARVVTCAEAGHFVQEESSDVMAKELQRFLGNQG
jgi:pimeloyl-ACP methyl ester carboxylesterase